MSDITKEQWKELEKMMANGWFSIKMCYQNYELGITRVRTSESQTALAVYINGIYQNSWGWPESMRSEGEPVPTIIADVWKKKTKAKHSAKDIKALEKIYGKRRAKKEIPSLYERWEYFVPLFPKASILCRQFKKLKGLELVSKETV